jgi:hypothetical protein
MEHGGMAMKHKVLFLGIFLLIMALIAACATTTLTSVWKDPAYQSGQIRKVLVMGVADKPAIKRLYEDEFARELKLKGVDAVPAYAVLPAEGVPDKEMIRSKVTELTIDAILITRMVDKKTVDTYYPPETISPTPAPYPYSPGYYHPGYRPPGAYNDWYGYYSDCYNCVTTPGYQVQDEIVVLETNLYEAKTDKLIWSALSDTFVETFDRGSSGEMIKSFIQVIIKKLSEDRVI